LLRALVMNHWLATAAAVLKVAATLSPLSPDEEELAQAQEALVASGLPKPLPEGDHPFPATWPAPFAPTPPLVNLNLLSPLHLAVALNQLDWVKLLLQAQGPLAKVRDPLASSEVFNFPSARGPGFWESTIHLSTTPFLLPYVRGLHAPLSTELD
jgi:hypothetical protein